MFNFKSLSLLPLVATLGLAGNVQAESIKVAITFPKGSAGEKPAKTLPTTTKMTPCDDAAKIDAATFSVTYDARKGTDILDTYVLIYNPEATGDKVYSVQRDFLAGGVVVTAHATAAALDVPATAPDPYVAAANNFAGASVTDLLFGSSIIVEGLATGTWQLIGILADPATPIVFSNPSTWAAWDVQTVTFGTPWRVGAATCV
ncbi:MAG: hypothetical protein ACNA7G_04345 [Methylobacter sp.]